MTYVIIRSPSKTKKKVKDSDPIPSQLTDTERKGDPSTARGTKAPEHGLEQTTTQQEQRQSAPKKGDIYQRRTRYDDAYLQENLESLSQRFLESLHNPEDPLNHAAKQGLHVYAETMAQREGTSLSQAARENNLSLGSLTVWVRQRLVPTLYKDSHTTYIATEVAQKTAAVQERARKTGKQPVRLLRRIFGK
jgi:hypothetical protein